jgi:hypothetical protein
MAEWRRQWPVLPTFFYGGMSYGSIEKPGTATGSNGKANGKPG